jgi:hypothetical protein
MTPTTTPNFAGEGVAAISPNSIIVNSLHTMQIDFTAGSTAWVNGTLHLVIPPNWSPPQTVDPATTAGYLSLTVDNGVANISSATGMDVVISVTSLAATTGVIHIFYGQGALFATSNTVSGGDQFTIETAPVDTFVQPILVQPTVVVNP